MRPCTYFLRFSRNLLVARYYSVDIKPKSGLWKPDNTVISPYKPLTIPNISLSEYIWQNVEKWEHKTAVVCAATNQSLTYNQLYNYSRNFAANLRTKLKIRDYDVVYVMMPNSIEFPVAVLGALEAGAAVTTVNPASTIRELVHTLLSTNPKVIITTAEFCYHIKEALNSISKNVPVIAVRNTKDLPNSVNSYQELAEDNNVDQSVLKVVRRYAEDVALLPFSSGTTGIPKQVELTNRNLIASCMTQNIAEIKVHNETTSSHQDTIMAFLPFFHMYGMAILLLHNLSVGAKLVILPRFQPATFLSAMKDHKVDVIYAVPPTVLFLGSYPLVSKNHLESVRNLIWSAAPMAPEDFGKCLNHFRKDLKVTEMYGSTEALLVSVSLPNRQNAGHALSNIELKIVGLEHGQNLGPNEVGGLLVRGPQIMKNYRNDYEATKNAFDENNWFKTGDLAYIDKDGALKIVDRIKELIKVKGFQVAPTELENILKEHPSVLDAVVIGVPDKNMGEAPRAFIILKDEVQEKDIIDFVNDKVADYKKIKSIVIINEIPKSPSGKVLRKVIKETYSSFK
ncbi:hypothetical protein K1T71_008151 [Dendrolimus kikuchii]|uniref:Uncharacterized protein n=1 Tax=Dendrolimus kikuchii TaxID=765133 RepID=A0ACC1CXH5_9NEOP|nr:hypothetical protein K1T71_008151 [Dendrolimus kikuchii]